MQKTQLELGEKMENTEQNDIRWKQRFQNYKKAFSVLRRGLELQNQRPLNELERGGLIQAFEFTQELSWKVLKDFIEERGTSEKIYGSKDVIRYALQSGIISNGEVWFKMIEARNLSSHTYDESDAVELVRQITEEFAPCFVDLEKRFEQFI